MKMKTLLFILFFYPMFSFAGGGGSVAGNGGDVLVCKDGTVLFFDIFEAEQARGLRLDLGPKGMTAYEKVNYVFNKIPDGSMGVWKYKLKKRFFEFKNKSIIGNFDLVDIPDTGNIVTKAGCQIKQVAIQKDPVVPEDPIYFISASLWKRMDEDSRVALILHEIIYRDAILLGHIDSVATRAINSYLMAEELTSGPVCTFIRMLQHAKLSSMVGSFTINKLSFDAATSLIDNRCFIQSGFVTQGESVIEGYVFNPINVLKRQFISEAGIAGLNAKSPETPRIVHFSDPMEIVIGKYKLQLANLRNKFWERTAFWYEAKANSSPVIQRPGFVHTFESGKIAVVSVAKMQYELFGTLIDIRGDVYFGEESRDVERIEFAPSVAIKIFEKEVKISSISKSDIPGAFVVSLLSPYEYTIQLPTGEMIRLSSDQDIILSKDGSYLGETDLFKKSL